MCNLFAAKVVELEVYMTPAMTEIYQAIAELMDACIKELRKSNKIDTSELAVESGLFRSFDDIVRRQLDSVWHTVSPRTKQVGPAKCYNLFEAAQNPTVCARDVSASPQRE